MAEPPTIGSATNTGFIGPVMVCGFATAVAMWCAAFITHMPWVDLRAGVAGPVVLGFWLVSASVAGAALPRRAAPAMGAASGLVTAVLGLLILGSLLVEQPIDGAPAAGAGGLKPDNLFYIPGFLALGTVIGLAGGWIGSRLSRRESQAGAPDWLCRFAILTAVSIAPLLLIGGAVTSTGSGMAIRGWPGSDTANMFLYPISLMADPQRFLEHTHRLFGALVGLSCIALFVYTLAARAPRGVRWAAGILLLAVVIQGYLGGGRVNLDDRILGIIHGIGAHLIIALAAAIAACLTRTFRDPPGLVPARPGRRLRKLTVALLVALLIQLVLGATFRHLAPVTKGAWHALYTHVAFSVVVVTLALLVGFKAAWLGKGEGGHPPIPILRRTGKALWHTVALQFVLGGLAFWAVMVSPTRTGPPPAPGGGPIEAPMLEVLVTSAHQAIGALLLTLATLNAIWARRFSAP